MLINAEEVMRICHASRAAAYQIIRQLNDELQKKGYLTRPGRVERRYLLERFNIQEETTKEG